MALVLARHSVQFETTINLQEVPGNWAHDLFLKRAQGRRLEPNCAPPYLTHDGIVLEDRRSKRDRRQIPGLISVNCAVK